MSRRNLRVAILKFLEERKNQAFDKYDVASYFDNMPMREIIFALYELKKLGKIETYERDNKVYYLAKRR